MISKRAELMKLISTCHPHSHTRTHAHISEISAKSAVAGRIDNVRGNHPMKKSMFSHLSYLFLEHISFSFLHISLNPHSMLKPGVDIGLLRNV